MLQVQFVLIFMSKCIAPLSGDEFYAGLSLVVPERDSHYDFFVCVMVFLIHHILGFFMY